MIDPVTYFSFKNPKKELARYSLRLGVNCLVFYQQRQDWDAFPPETRGWKPATSRVNPLGGEYVARVHGTTAAGVEGEKIAHGFTTTGMKGAGIRVYEYANSETTKACRIQLIEGIGRWAKAYEAMCEHEDSFREDYELWKDEFHGHFKKSDYPDIYPDYDPMKPDAEKDWVTIRFAAALKDARRLGGMTQEELAEKAGISMFTLRSYEQGKRLPRKKQMEAICDALGITECALSRHYFGSPNQAMHHLFSLAGAANLMPENDAEAGPRLRTQGNMVEFVFVSMADKVEELGEDPSATKQDEFVNWLNTFSCEDDDTILTARKTGRLWGNDRNLPPKA